MGVATAASLVTGVGVIAGMGVAGVRYAKAKREERERKRSEMEEEVESGGGSMEQVTDQEVPPPLVESSQT